MFYNVRDSKGKFTKKDNYDGLIQIDNGFTETIYYDVLDGRRACVYLLTNDEGDTIRGASVCSKKDNFNRKVGRELAQQRALEAMEHYGDSESVEEKYKDGFILMSSDYIPTEFEQKLIGKNIERIPTAMVWSICSECGALKE